MKYLLLILTACNLNAADLSSALDADVTAKKIIAVTANASTDAAGLEAKDIASIVLALKAEDDAWREVRYVQRARAIYNRKHPIIVSR